jgi:periplasmic protein TonB
MKNILSDKWLELVFIDRNKDYGAFQLRKESNENQIYGLVISNLIVIILLTVYQISVPKVDLTQNDEKPIVFKNNKEKIEDHQRKKVQKQQEELKIVELETDFALQPEKVIEKKTETIISNISDGVMKYAIDAKTGKRFTPEKFASFSGGMDSFYVSIQKQIKVDSENEIDFEINTIVYIECVVTTTGKLDSVSLFKGSPDPKFNDRILAAFKNSDLWKPAMNKGVAVRQRMIIPFHFDYKQSFLKYIN